MVTLFDSVWMFVFPMNVKGLVACIMQSTLTTLMRLDFEVLGLNVIFQGHFMNERLGAKFTIVGHTFML